MKKLKGLIDTFCLGDRHGHSDDLLLSSTRTEVICRLLSRIISFYKRFRSYAQDKRADRAVSTSSSHGFQSAQKELKEINLKVIKSAV